jgi:hypothetical protein
MPDAAPDNRANVPVDKTRAAVGCLLGTAVGDALGLAVEGLSARRPARMYPQLKNYHFLFGCGCISDDTERACMLAQALIVSLDEDIARFERRLGSSLGWRLRFWFLSFPAGIGLATGRAIIKPWLGSRRGLVVCIWWVMVLQHAPRYSECASMTAQSCAPPRMLPIAIRMRLLDPCWSRWPPK